MSIQRRMSTPSAGGATPGRDDEYPTDTFDSVVGAEVDREDAGWEESVEQPPRPTDAARRDPSRRGVTASSDSGATAQDDERPTQVFSAYRDEPVGPAPVAEQLFGGAAAAEEDDTAVFARYRDGDSDPRATGAVVPVPPPRDDHTEQFAAYRDDAYDGRGQVADAGSRSGLRTPVPPVPPVPPVSLVPTPPSLPGAPAAGKRALREPDVPEDQRVSSGRRALREPVGQPGPEGQPAADAAVEDAQSSVAGQADAPAGEDAAVEPVLDKKAAKRLAKEQQQAAKEAAKAEKAAAEQTAKEEKAAAKAVKKTGRARGAKGVPAAGDAAVPDGAAAPDGTAVAGGAAVVGAAVGAAGVALAGSDVPEQTGTDGRGAAPAEATGEAAGHPQAAATVTPAVARRRPPILVVLLLLFIAASSGAGAWLFQQQAVTATKQRPSSNIALLDKAATAEVVAQISKAIEAIYTYDSATLDASESQALSQITGSYVDDFRDTIASVRALPAQQRASLSSKVVAAGVITMTERRASLLVMLDQVGRRGENAQTGKSAVRLRVTAQRVDGQWKVSDIDQK